MDYGGLAAASFAGKRAGDQGLLAPGVIQQSFKRANTGGEQQGGQGIMRELMAELGVAEANSFELSRLETELGFTQDKVEYTVDESAEPDTVAVVGETNEARGYSFLNANAQDATATIFVPSQVCAPSVLAAGVSLVGCKTQRSAVYGGLEIVGRLWFFMGGRPGNVEDINQFPI